MINTAVFSQWSAPHRIKSRHSSIDLTGLALWVLAVNRAKVQFPRIELVTDQMGADLLVNKIGLVFDSVRVVLDDFVDANLSHIWALGKLKTYSLMEEPFLHIDHDVILWKTLPERVLNVPLVCQHPEHLAIGHWRRDWYDLKVLKGIPWKPDWITERLGRPDDLALNMGIYGGSDLDFLHEAAQAGLDTAMHPRNRIFMQKAEGTVMSVFLEQNWTATLARKRGKSFEYLLSEDREINKLQSKALGYAHYFGEKKRKEVGQQSIKSYCQQYYPTQFAICEEIAEQDNK